MKTLIILITTMLSASAFADVRNNTLVRATPTLGTPHSPTIAIPAAAAPVTSTIVLGKSSVRRPAQPVVQTPTTPNLSAASTNVVIHTPAASETTTPNIDPTITAPQPLVASQAIIEARQEYAASEVTSGGTPEITSAGTGAGRADAGTASPPRQIHDLPNCKSYTTSPSADCWTASTQQKIKTIVASIKYVNYLRDSYVDPRYMLCTGYRESGFDPEIAFVPNITNSIGARGMYQVMNATADAAVRTGGPRVPGFTNLNGDQYRAAMISSTAAQIELSHMVLEMKIREGKNRTSNRDGRNVRFSDKALTTGATNDDYWHLAYLYFGVSTEGKNYARAVMKCYDCLSQVSTANLENAVPIGTIKNCLQKAKD